MAHHYITLTQAQVLEYYRMGLGEPAIVLINHSHTTSHHHKKIALRAKGMISLGVSSKNPVKATINPRHYSIKPHNKGYYADTCHEADLTNYPILHWKRWNTNTLYNMARAHVENFRDHTMKLLAYEKTLRHPHANYRPVSVAAQAHGYDSPEYHAAYDNWNQRQADAYKQVQENRNKPRPILTWDRVEVMADALEEAGCTDNTLLELLRGNVPPAYGYNDKILEIGEQPRWNPPEEFRVYSAGYENDPEFRRYRDQYNKELSAYTTARAKILNARESYDWTIYRLCLRIAHR